MKALGTLLALSIMLSASVSWANGVFMVVKGDIKLSQKGKKPVPARVGMKVTAQDKVIAGKDARAKIEMIDKNILNISPNSEVVIEVYKFNPQNNEKSVSLNVLYGKVRATVNQKYDDEKNKFQVKTPSAVAGVRGTDFLTSYTPSTNASKVVTFEGSVTVGSGVDANGKIANPVVVPAGSFSVASNSAPPSPPAPVPKSELQAMNKESNTDGGARPVASNRDVASEEGGEKDSDKKDSDKKDSDKKDSDKKDSDKKDSNSKSEKAKAEDPKNEKKEKADKQETKQEAKEKSNSKESGQKQEAPKDKPADKGPARSEAKVDSKGDSDGKSENSVEPKSNAETESDSNAEPSAPAPRNTVSNDSDSEPSEGSREPASNEPGPSSGPSGGPNGPNSGPISGGVAGGGPPSGGMGPPTGGGGLIPPPGLSGPVGPPIMAPPPMMISIDSEIRDLAPVIPTLPDLPPALTDNIYRPPEVPVDIIQQNTNLTVNINVQ